MASLNRETKPLRTLSSGAEDLILTGFSFAPNGSTTVVDPTTFKGFVSAIVRSNTGVYQCTLPCGFPDIISLKVAPQHQTVGGAGTTGITYELGAVSPSAGTLTINMINTGTTTAVDLAANAANRINVTMLVSRSLYTK